MLVALYARVSTGRQAGEGGSIERQIDMLKDWADKSGHTIVNVFSEAASAYHEERESSSKGTLH